MKALTGWKRLCKRPTDQIRKLPFINSVATNTCSTMRLSAKPRYKLIFFVPYDSHGCEEEELMLESILLEMNISISLQSQRGKAER